MVKIRIYLLLNIVPEGLPIPSTPLHALLVSAVSILIEEVVLTVIIELIRSACHLIVL